MIYILPLEPISSRNFATRWHQFGQVFHICQHLRYVIVRVRNSVLGRSRQKNWNDAMGQVQSSNLNTVEFVERYSVSAQRIGLWIGRF